MHHVDAGAARTIRQALIDLRNRGTAILVISEELDELFLKEAKKVGLTTLKGHRSVGGMRASIYNAMPMAGVEALVGFMAEFQRKHG